MSPETEGFSVMMRDLDMGAAIELSYGGFASQTNTCHTWHRSNFWLAKLYEVFPATV